MPRAWPPFFKEKTYVVFLYIGRVAAVVQRPL